MKTLLIYIEMEGKQIYAGNITYNNPQDAEFAYADEYLRSVDASAISVSLPLQEERFDAIRTKNFLKDCFRRDLPEER